MQTMKTTRVAQRQLRARASVASRPSMLPRKGARCVRRVVLVRASEEEGPLDGYMKISNQVPPLATATAIPVIAVSLLCKALTGSGLPGPLGLVEGISFLVLPLGLGSFVPVVGEIVSKGDFSSDAVMNQLTQMGDSATGKINLLKDKVDPNSALGMQLADLRKQQDAKARETPEETKVREERNARLAELAKQVGKKISADEMAEAGLSEGEENEEKLLANQEKLKSQKITETIANSITSENFDEDITKYDEEDLGGKLDLSSTDVTSGTPTAQGKVGAK